MVSFKEVLVLALVTVATAYADSANENLIKACTNEGDNTEDVKAALNQNADINFRDEGTGQTCLMSACLRGKINIVKYMFELGADTSISESMGYTPPHGAGFQGRAEVMQFLADSGLDVNEFHDDGFAPLHRTCWGREERHTQTFKVLIDLSVDPELPSKSGMKCRDMTKNEGILKLLGDSPAHKEL